MPNEEAGLARQFVKKLPTSKKIETIICPSHTGLMSVKSALIGSRLVLGAQDVAVSPSGAFTGEVSAEMIKDIGVKYCIVGHSERRAGVGETDLMVNQKIIQLLLNDIIPIICIGETHQERVEGKHELTIIRQLESSLRGISGERPMIITYEPVWAISPNGPAEPEQVGPMVGLIYQTLIDRFPKKMIDSNFTMIYGGSVNGDNIKDFLKLEHVSGALVGNASLVLDSFSSIIKNI